MKAKLQVKGYWEEVIDLQKSTYLLKKFVVGVHSLRRKKQLMDDRVAANVLNSSVTLQLSNQLQKLTLNDKDISQMEDEDEEQTELTGGEMTQKMGCDQLIKLRKDNLAKRRKQMKFMRMPDLTETLETGLITNMSNSNSVVPVIEENSEEEGEEETLGDNVMPSIPESFLEQMGLSTSQKTTTGPDQLSEEEVEKKFMKLALAFKTDKITLEKRREIQERSRDIAEENVAKEVKGLREACDKMNQICLDSQVREVLLKIQRHVDVMEQASARVSSRAEVYGAVQQERRMSKAIEIMLLHVENLRMMHEREHAELEEAKRLIQDNRPFGGSSGYEFGRRSLSVCPETSMHSRMSKRRVSEVIGKTPGGLGSLSRSESADPRQRFQQVVSSTASKNNIVSSLRRTSLEKQSSSSSLNRPSDSFSENGSALKSVSKQNSEEEAFQKGFQQGCKAQISGQLAQLRDQQNSVTQKLEDLRDTLEEEEISPPISLKEVVIQKVWQIAPDYDTISKHLRVTMAGFVFLMAICSIVLSFFPVSQATVEVYPQYRHVNKPTL